VIHRSPKTYESTCIGVAFVVHRLSFVFGAIWTIKVHDELVRGRTLPMQQYMDLLIDALLDEGFSVEEASKLIRLQEQYEERLATEETNYHRFIRWLVEHGRISDW
jgi:hypothetical protein